MLEKNDLKAIAELIASSEEHMIKRFDKVDKYLDGVDQHFDGVDKQLNGVDQHFDEMDKSRIT